MLAFLEREKRWQMSARMMSKKLLEACWRAAGGCNDKIKVTKASLQGVRTGERPEEATFFLEVQNHNFLLMTLFSSKRYGGRMLSENTTFPHSEGKMQRRND